jgi:hypothetical protein
MKDAPELVSSGAFTCPPNVDDDVLWIDSSILAGYVVRALSS